MRGGECGCGIVGYWLMVLRKGGKALLLTNCECKNV